MDCQRGVLVCVHNEHDLIFPGSEGGGGGWGWMDCPRGVTVCVHNEHVLRFPSLLSGSEALVGSVGRC